VAMQREARRHHEAKLGCALGVVHDDLDPLGVVAVDAALGPRRHRVVMAGLSRRAQASS